MTLDYSNRIVKWEAHGDLEKSKKHDGKSGEVINASPIGVFVHDPIASKKDQCTRYEEAHYNKIGFEMRILILDV